MTVAALTVRREQGEQSARRAGRFFFYAAAVLTGVLAWGIVQGQTASALLAGLGLLGCGALWPQALLILALAALPFATSLTGENPHGGLAVGVSDLLFFAALPGLAWQGGPRNIRRALGRWSLPILLFLGAGLLAFAIQPHPSLSALAGFARTAQIVLLLPLGFAAVEWTPDELRNLLRGYLLSASALAFWCVAIFAGGGRLGMFTLGMHKNAVGLALAVGALIAAALFTQTQHSANTPENALPLQIAPRFSGMLACLCLAGLACTLSRGSYVSLMAGMTYLAFARRDGRIFLAALLWAVLTMGMLKYLLPPSALTYVSSAGMERKETRQRYEIAQQCLQEFRRHPLLGDGFRARRDFLPHNLELGLLAENGLVGIGLFGWILIEQGKILGSARRAFRSDPLRECVCLVVIAGAVALFVHGQFDPYWRRGPVWLPWAGTGLLLAIRRAGPRALDSLMDSTE